MKTIKAASLAGALLLASLPVTAENEFPERPVTIVVPFGAGGGTDGLARIIQSTIDKYDLLPTPVVVVNATGAAGTVGSRQVLRADPDGYTILQIHQEMFAASALGRVNYAPSDFEPVIQISEACMFVAVPKDSKLESLDQMFEFARENPNDFKQADDIGGATHFPSAQLMSTADVQWPIIPTGATSKRFASLKGGFSDMALMSPLWIERGAEDLKPLAVMGDNRYGFAPELPTAKELGYDVNACLNRRYWAPSGTPQDRIDVLADAIESATNTQDVKDYLTRTGEDLVVLRGEALKEAIQADYHSYLSVVDIVQGTSSN